MHKIPVCLLSAAIVAAFILVVPGAAQVDRSALTGTVTDATGAVVVGAKVKVEHQGSGLERVGEVGSSGSYMIQQLPIGVYTVRFEAPGFRGVQYDKVQMLVGQTRTLDVQLEIATSSTQVEVRDTAVALDRSSAELGSVLQSSQVGQLPINGRHWAGLMLLAPGAVNTGDGSQGSTRFIGRANDDNNWTYDGVDNTAVKDPTYGSNLRLVVSMDAIAEFKVSSALYTADSGNGMGGQVHLVSKSGSNTFHGGLFEYIRNSAVDARNIFSGAKLPPFRLNQFGGSLGGPVKHDKAFFFFNYEGLRQRQGSTYTYQVPSDALRARVLATSPALKPIIDAYPLAERPTRDADVGEIVRDFSRKSDEDSFQVRFDYNLSSKTSMFARYSRDAGSISDPGGIRDEFRDTDSQTPSNAVFQLQRTFSPTVLNETRLGFNRAPLGEVNYGAFWGTLNVPGLSALPDSSYNNEKGTTYSIIDNLAIFRGKHNLKFGGEIRRIHCNVGFAGNANPTYSRISDFVNNRVDSASFSQNFGALGARRTYLFTYAQDEIKLKQNLTLNLGVRYEYYSVINEVKGREVVFDIVKGDFAPPGTPVYQPDRNNFAPRVSLTWAPGALANKTVIRAGYGMYYGPGQVDDVMGAMESVQERYALTNAEAPGLSYPIDRFASQAKSQGLTPRHIRSDRRDMYSQHWGVSVQQKLPADFMMQVGYAGNNAHKILSRLYINPLDPVTRTRPWPKFGRIDSKESAGNGNFNGLQVSAKRAMKKGVLWQSEYMWSHALNDGAIGGGESTAAMISTNRRADKADSNYDIRHNWSSNVVWQLPIGPGQRFLAYRGLGGKLAEGWELSGIHAARTGRAVNISVTRSANDMPDGNASNQRPNRVPNVPLYPANKTIDNWINPAAFAVPAKFVWGNASRNLIRGPGVNQFDIALQKSTVLRESHKIAFRAEFFNIFNRAHLSTPGGNISSASSFGRITSPLNRAVGTGTARQIQFMLRYLF